MFAVEVPEEATYVVVATDRTGEPARPLHATGSRRPRGGETVEVIVER